METRNEIKTGNEGDYLAGNLIQEKCLDDCLYQENVKPTHNLCLNTLLVEEAIFLGNYDFETGRGYRGLQEFRMNLINALVSAGLGDYANEIRLRKQEYTNIEWRKALGDLYQIVIPEQDKEIEEIEAEMIERNRRRELYGKNEEDILYDKLLKEGKIIK